MGAPMIALCLKTLGIPLGGHFLFTPANLFSAFRLSVSAFCKNTFLFIAFSYVIVKIKKSLQRNERIRFFVRTKVSYLLRVTTLIYKYITIPTLSSTPDCFVCLYCDTVTGVPVVS